MAKSSTYKYTDYKDINDIYTGFLGSDSGKQALTWDNDKGVFTQNATAQDQFKMWDDKKWQQQKDEYLAKSVGFWGGVLGILGGIALGVVTGGAGLVAGAGLVGTGVKGITGASDNLNNFNNNIDRLQAQFEENNYNLETFYNDLIKNASSSRLSFNQTVNALETQYRQLYEARETELELNRREAELASAKSEQRLVNTYEENERARANIVVRSALSGFRNSGTIASNIEIATEDNERLNKLASDEHDMTIYNSMEQVRLGYLNRTNQLSSTQTDIQNAVDKYNQLVEFLNAETERAEGDYITMQGNITTKGIRSAKGAYNNNDWALLLDEITAGIETGVNAYIGNKSKTTAKNSNKG